MPAIPRLLLPLLAAALVSLAVACSASGKPYGRLDIPSTVVPDTADSTQPAATVPSGSPRLRASLQGSCRLLDVGSEITMTYTVTNEGGGVINRIQFLVNGSVAEEMNNVTQREVARTATVKVDDGSRHTFQVNADAGGSARTTVTSVISCPSPPAGQRN